MTGTPAAARAETLPRWGIVGDDLTGSAAIAGEFVRRGVVCPLLIDREQRWPVAGNAEGATAIAVLTQSRHLPDAEASRTVADVSTRLLTDQAVTHLFKKLDSLLNGPVGAELAAFSRAGGGGAVLATFASPWSGRSTVGGIQLVDGIPLSGPAGSEPALLAHGHGVDVVHLDSVTLRGMDRWSAADWLRRAAERPVVVVSDAERHDDLALLAEAGLSAGIRRFAGTSEFAGMLAESTVGAPTAALAQSKTVVRRPVLVIVGSLSSTSSRQFGRLLDAGAAAVEIPDARDDESLCLLAETNGVLAMRPAPAVASERIDQGFAERVAGRAAALLAMATFMGVVATGGDTALAVALALGAQRLDVLRVHGLAIVECRLADGPHVGLPLVVKPGAFGDDDALVSAVAAIDPDASTRVGR